MKIHKIGHCCLVIEEGDTRIMTDPGRFTEEQRDIKGLDGILITHEHEDHLDVEQFKEVVAGNPDARVITNKGVSKILNEQEIKHEVVKEGESFEIKGVKIEVFGEEHEYIYEKVPTVVNTGYLIAEKLYIPGDSLFVPDKTVEVLALPLGAPWGRIGDVINYAKKVKPKKCFPIHDGMLKIYGPYHLLPEKFLPQEGISFVALKPDEEITI